MAVPPTPVQSDAKVLLDRLLDEYGLSNLKDWAWEQVVLNRTTEEIITYLYERPEFKARFPAIEARRKAGLAPITAGEYVTYEESARQAMRAANMPTGFWDKPADYTALIANDVSIDELNTRITQGYQRVAQAPNAVRDAYRSYFGINGDAALASHFLDPQKAQAILTDQVRQAEFGGVAAQHSWNVRQDQSEQWSKRNFTYQELESGFGKVDQMKPLFEETVGEGLSNEDDLGLNEGLHVAFGESDPQVFEKRLAARKAKDAGQGGAYTQESGATGLGSAWP